MKRVATETGVVRVPVVIKMVPVEYNLAIVLDEIRHVVVLNESIECHLCHCRFNNYFLVYHIMIY